MRTVRREDIRPSAVAGFFYPGQRDTLEFELAGLMDVAPTVELSGDIVALISPHAGYQYSGSVAAVGFRQVVGCDIDVAAIIGPSHHEAFPGVSVFNGKGYETPMGTIDVAQTLAEELIAQDERLKSSWQGHQREHALEVQLPFIQRVLPECKILPIAIGKQSEEICTRLGEALATVLQGRKALIVATSDLSHFHSYDEAVAIDEKTCKLIERFDEDELGRAATSGECEACGLGPIVAAMVASKKLGANKAKTLLYLNSGDVAGDRSRVVGYTSAAFYRQN